MHSALSTRNTTRRNSGAVALYMWIVARLGADQGLRGALDQVLAGLGQHRHRDVVGDLVALDQLPDEVEVGLAGRREADLDLLVAHAPPAGRTSCACGPGSSGRSGPGCRPADRCSAIAGLARSACSGQVRSGRSTRGERAVALEGHRARLLGGHGLQPGAEAWCWEWSWSSVPRCCCAGCRTGRTTNSAARAPALAGPAAAAKEEQPKSALDANHGPHCS